MQKFFLQSLGSNKTVWIPYNGLVLTSDTHGRLGVAGGSVCAQVKFPLIVATDKQL